jgi:hypothetical protein
VPPEVEQTIVSWLHKYLPGCIRTEDIEEYSLQLFNMGFDSAIFLDEELLPDDLKFMKEAHKRVLVRKLKESRHPRFI